MMMLIFKIIMKKVLTADADDDDNDFASRSYRN